VNLLKSSSPRVVTLLLTIGHEYRCNPCFSLKVGESFLCWKLNFSLHFAFGIMLAAKGSLWEPWAQEHTEQGFLWPFLSFQKVLLSNYSQGVGTVGGEPPLSMVGTSHSREEMQRVREMPSGTCAVGRALEERAACAASWPRHGFGWSICRDRPRWGFDADWLSSHVAGVLGSCGALFGRRGQRYCEVADLGQKWGLGEWAASCLAGVGASGSRIAVCSCGGSLLPLLWYLWLLWAEAAALPPPEFDWERQGEGARCSDWERSPRPVCKSEMRGDTDEVRMHSQRAPEAQSCQSSHCRVLIAHTLICTGWNTSRFLTWQNCECSRLPHELCARGGDSSPCLTAPAWPGCHVVAPPVEVPSTQSWVGEIHWWRERCWRRVRTGLSCSFHP